MASGADGEEGQEDAVGRVTCMGWREGPEDQSSDGGTDS